MLGQYLKIIDFNIYELILISEAFILILNHFTSLELLNYQVTN
jgi:hypothetical protein